MITIQIGDLQMNSMFVESLGTFMIGLCIVVGYTYRCKGLFELLRPYLSEHFQDPTFRIVGGWIVIPIGVIIMLANLHWAVALITYPL